MSPKETTAVSIAEILDALALAAGAAEAGPADAFTTQDLMAAKQMGLLTARRMIGTLKKEGKLVPCQVRREAIDGRMRVYSAYRIVK